MPVPFIFHVLENGFPDAIKERAWPILGSIATLALIITLRLWIRGAKNTAERDLHGKVFIVTGGTTGIGAQVVLEVARRGAQLVLLTQAPQTDPFLADYIQDIRNQTRNELVYAEQVDLASLVSVRHFATKWIDNSPPRRLDGILLCAATLNPPGRPRHVLENGIEEEWMVNFLANFHLLSILSPALRAQPFDRDVRVIFTTCSSYIGSPPLAWAKDKNDPVSGRPKWSSFHAYAQSKFAMMTFLHAFQKHLDAYKRSDELPMNTNVILVNPGFTRTPGMRRWLTRGTLWGLCIYLSAYILPAILLKTPEEGAQSVLHALMETSYGRKTSEPNRLFVPLIKECTVVDYARKDLHDEAIAKTLWEKSDALIVEKEKSEAQQRALAKKQQDQKEKEAQSAKEEAEKLRDIQELVDTIRTGREADKKARERKKAAVKSDKKKGAQ